MTALVVALAVAVALLAVLVAGLLRSHAEILRALHELGAGLELDRQAAPAGPEVAPGVARPRREGRVRVPAALAGTVLARDGEQEAVALPLGRGPVLLAFLSSGCTGCAAFWDAFADEVPDVPGGARLLVVARGEEEESLAALRARVPARVPLVLSSDAWDAFDVPGSPYFALVVDGTLVGEGSGATWPQVADLLGQALQGAGSTGRRREARDDAALLAAGIGPGHPSLTVPAQPPAQP